VILFGGASAQGVPLNDVLTLPLAPGHGWSQLTVVGTPPSPRYGACAIYDPARDRVLIYGGGNNAPGVRYDDLWELSLSGVPTWTRRFPGGLAPSGKFFPTAILDPVRGRMVMFGGLNGSGTLGLTWQLSLSEPMTWAPVNASDPPSDRYAASAIYDAARDRMVVFGGNISNQVYALQFSSPPFWTLLAEGGPMARGDASAVYDAARQRMVVFGGYNYLTYPSDVWAYDLAAGGWTELHPDGPIPAGRANAAALYDPIRDRMLVVGGAIFSTSHAYNDVLSLQWSGALGVGPGAGAAMIALAPARPNPARDGVDIPFTLAGGGRARVRLYDVSGRLVRQLADGELPAGPNLIRWDRRDARGEIAPAGLYLVELRAGKDRLARRVVVTD
jgi:hypothetical protein